MPPAIFGQNECGRFGMFKFIGSGASGPVAVVGALLCLALPAFAAAATDKVQIGDNEKVFPESVTSIADGTLFAGSITEGVVFKSAPGAAKALPFIPKQADGPQSVLGVYADEHTGLLWVCYSDLAIFSGKPSLPAVVRSFDIASGASGASYKLPDGSFCNDVATASDGTAYISDTNGGRVLRLKPGASSLEEWLKDDSLKGVDGLSLAKDGKLYVNNVMTNSLLRVDVSGDGSPGKPSALALSQPIKGPDGMRFGEDGVLYLAENAAGQVDAVSIDGDKATIKALKTGFDTPTAVSKVGNTLFVLEGKLGLMGKATDPGQFFIYAVRLASN